MQEGKISRPRHVTKECWCCVTHLLLIIKKGDGGGGCGGGGVGGGGGGGGASLIIDNHITHSLSIIQQNLHFLSNGKAVKNKGRVSVGWVLRFFSA